MSFVRELLHTRLSLLFSMPRHPDGTLPSITLAAIAVFVLLMPFYVLPSGLPQPAHLLFIVLLGVAFYRREHRRFLTLENDVFVPLLGAYICWTVVINALHATIAVSFEPFVYNFYYIFGGLVALSLFSASAAPIERRWGYTQLEILFGLVALTLALQLLVSIFGIGRAFYHCRTMNFFNNPNQLGYFAVLASTLGALVGEKAKVSRAAIYALLAAGMMLALFSVSRAAVFAVIAVVAAFIILYERDFRIWAIAIIGGLVLYAVDVQKYFVLSNNPECIGRITASSIPDLPAGVVNYGFDPARDLVGRQALRNAQLAAAMEKLKAEAEQTQTDIKAAQERERVLREKADTEIAEQHRQRRLLHDEWNRQAKEIRQPATGDTERKKKANDDYKTLNQREAEDPQRIVSQKPKAFEEETQLKKQVLATYLKRKEQELIDLRKKLAKATKKREDEERAELAQTPIYCLEKAKANESQFMRQVRYRQYHHLFVNPKLLLLGAGDGRNERFCGLEIHSTLGAVLLYHGFVGLILFSLLMLRTVLVDWRAATFVLVPAMLYGLTHNGLRNPLLFGLMAVVVGVSARGRDIVRTTA